MSSDNNIINTRDFMQRAVEAMRKSIGENRTDKVSPLVGAVAVLPNGRIETAFRGEFSDGEHAEYTLLERRLISDNLAGATLFCTLEPCAPGARSKSKTSCAERIVNRRISHVWVGIEDPDPLVDSRGIQYLQEHGVSVEMFDRDLQEEIRKINMEFIKGAEVRASQFQGDSDFYHTSELEKPISNTSLNDFNTQEIEEFINKVEEFNFKYKSEDFLRVFTQLRYLAKVDDKYYPTGLGILLFGTYPQIFFPNAVIRATYKNTGKNEDIETFSGSLPKQAEESYKWFKRMIGKQGDRTDAKRKDIYNYPTDVIRESINNALAHRSYDIEGGSIHLIINDDMIEVKSPGGPVKAIKMERMQKLDAPYLSKNPKITYVFEKLDLSESRGLGFETIRNLPLKHNLPLPVVSFDNPFLSFIYLRAYGNGKSNDGQFDKLSVSETKGYDYIRLNSPITRKLYEENLGVSSMTANRHIGRLITLGLIKKVGTGPKTTYEVL